MADTRDISMHFWATQEEYDLIQKNMALSGSTNLSAFLRKMAIDGMVIRLDMPEIQEMLHLLRRANASINAELLAMKKAAYPEYYKAKDEYRELLTYQANLAGLFGIENVRSAPQREHQQEEK